MLLWQTTEQLRHTCRHPSVPTSPIERNIRCMIEKTIRALQFIQVHHHFFRRPINIFTVLRHFIRMSLHNRNHVHVINPQTCLPGIPFFSPFLFFRLCICGNFPLRVGIRQSKIQVFLILCHSVHIQWKATEHIQIHMIHNRLQRLL